MSIIKGCMGKSVKIIFNFFPLVVLIHFNQKKLCNYHFFKYEKHQVNMVHMDGQTDISITICLKSIVLLQRFLCKTVKTTTYTELQIACV
jgi:hypothetical protein